MWEYCGMARNTESLAKAKQLVAKLEEDFWKSVFVNWQFAACGLCYGAGSLLWFYIL